MKHLSILLFLCLFSLSSMAETKGKFLFVKGKVGKSSTKKGKFKIVKKGTSVKYGDWIITKSGAIALIKIDGTNLKLKPDTKIQIQEPKIENEKSTVEYLLDRGELFFKRKAGNKNSKSVYRVRTKSAIMGVRGTQFFTTNKNNEVWMCVNEGEVEVTLTKGGKTKKMKDTVKPGEGIFINSFKLPEKKQYEWTKKLNWNMGEKGKVKVDDIEDKVNLNEVAYPLEDLDYE